MFSFRKDFFIFELFWMCDNLLRQSNDALASWVNVRRCKVPRLRTKVRMARSLEAQASRLRVKVCQDYLCVQIKVKVNTRRCRDHLTGSRSQGFWIFDFQKSGSFRFYALRIQHFSLRNQNFGVYRIVV